MINLYQSQILRHYHTPSNQGLLKKYSQKFTGANPFCGDEIEITIQTDKKGKIEKVGWSGKGCVISQAATSMFSQMITGKTLTQIKKIKSDTLLAELHMDLSPTRMKCALLPLYTMKSEGSQKVIVKND